VADRLRWDGPPSLVVGTSKTLKQLARLAGAPGQRKGPFVVRQLTLGDVKRWTIKLASMTAQERAALPGVSRARSPQILAGAIVAEATMRALDVDRLQICPWALREGILLRRLDALHRPAERYDNALLAHATVNHDGDGSGSGKRSAQPIDTPRRELVPPAASSSA